MAANVKTIKFTAWASGLLALITYFIAIKGTLGLTELSFLPDAFLLALFGGAFASMLVVLACEISKYLQNKQAQETYIFCHLYYLFGQLQIISNNIRFCNAGENSPVPENVLVQPISNAEAEMNALYFAEYTSFSKNNTFLMIKQDYNQKTFPAVQRALQECRYLQMAVLKDKIEQLEREMNSSVTDVSQQNTNLALRKLAPRIDDVIKLIDDIQARIDDLHGGKFNWQGMKKDAVHGLEEIGFDGFERFMNQADVLE